MIEAIGAILAAMLGTSLFKKKPYCIWIKQLGIWTNQNPGGNSFRRCMKAVRVFLDAGTPPELVMILAKGITPPKEG